MPSKKYNLVFASGATASNAQFVGPNRSVILVMSNVTSWNAGAGNASITVRTGASSEKDTTPTSFADIQSMTISTTPLLGAYVMPYACGPWLKVGFGTAVTGTATNNIDVIVSSEGY